MAAVLLLIVGGGIYGIYHYTRKDKVKEEAQMPAPIVDTPVAIAKPVVPDTTHHDSVAAAPVPVADTLQQTTFKMIIGKYPTKIRAEKRQSNLLLNGTRTDVVAVDSTSFLVIETISCRAKDTTHVKDSLSRMFGYKAVSIVK